VGARPLNIRSIDHVVLTVADVDRTIAFYERALGMTAVTFGEGRRALAFGDQKLNLHQAGREFEPKARTPTQGSADLCFLTDVPIAEVAAHLRTVGVDIELGPVAKAGARHPLRSLYFRDPDGNLIEVANEVRG
jgi:catechol 2,3-dioxygenase-like lactoylglutathione lyase family enzyme